MDMVRWKLVSNEKLGGLNNGRFSKYTDQHTMTSVTTSIFSSTTYVVCTSVLSLVSTKTE